MKRAFAISCVLLLTITLLLAALPSSGEETMTTFNGFPTANITFPFGGTKDTTTQISIEKKSLVFNATCDI